MVFYKEYTFLRVQRIQKEIEKEFQVITNARYDMLNHPECVKIFKKFNKKKSDEIWTSMLPRMNYLEYSVTNALGMWTNYLDARGELDKVITAISNIGEVLISVKDSIDIQSILASKFDLAMKLAIATAKRINALVAWSLLDVPMDPGPGCYQLGQLGLGPTKRNHFHLYFSEQEAKELQTMVIVFKQASDIVERFGL